MWFTSMISSQTWLDRPQMQSQDSVPISWVNYVKFYLMAAALMLFFLPFTAFMILLPRGLRFVSANGLKFLSLSAIKFIQVDPAAFIPGTKSF
jgi:hypothetical protein